MVKNVAGTDIFNIDTTSKITTLRVDDGVDGFVWWDRETESLWWPLINQAVSGQLKGVQLQELEEQYWEDLTWKELKRKFPTAQILISGQDYERPKEWKRLGETEIKPIVLNFSEK